MKVVGNRGEKKNKLRSIAPRGVVSSSEIVLLNLF